MQIKPTEEGFPAVPPLAVKLPGVAVILAPMRVTVTLLLCEALKVPAEEVIRLPESPKAVAVFKAPAVLLI